MATKTTPPAYCTQNGGDCPTCSLVNYGRDCANYPLKGRWFTLGELAEGIAGGNLYSMTRMLNDAGLTPKLNELDPDPGAFIPRAAVVDLIADRPADIVGRRAAGLLS